MMKLKTKAPAFVVNGTIGGHPFLIHKNHASGAAYVPIPVKQNVAQVYGRRMKASRPAIESINPKGAK